MSRKLLSILACLMALGTLPALAQVPPGPGGGGGGGAVTCGGNPCATLGAQTNVQSNPGTSASKDITVQGDPTGVPVPVTGTFSATIAGFAPASVGTPITATTGGATGTLPAGTTVVATNVGTTNAAYCALGASSSASWQYIAPNGGWFAYTVGVATQLTCVTSTSTTTVNMVGGSGLATGTGGGGGAGSSSNASVGATGSAVPASATFAAMSQGGNLTGFTGTSGNLNVQCANCSGSGVSTADKATFTSGSSLFAGSGGFFQTTATSNPLTTGQQGMFQATANRAIHVNLRDASANEEGITANPLQTNDTATQTAITAATVPVPLPVLPGPYQYTPVAGAQYNLAITSSTALTVPGTATYATVCAKTAAVNYTTDGATTPTSTVGTPLQALACVGISGAAVLTNFRAISATGTLTVEFFL